MLVTASVNFQKFAFMTKQIKLYRRMERLKASWQSCQMCVCVRARQLSEEKLSSVCVVRSPYLYV